MAQHLRTEVQAAAPEAPAPPTVSAPARARHAAPSRWRAGPAVALVVFAAAAGLFGLWVRLWMLAHAGVNSDEAIVGLMADAILRGHFSAFYWGQTYGGAEPYVVAGMFALFGHSATVLDLTPILLAAVAAVLTGAIGWTMFRRPGVAVAAAALTWVWPGSAVWNSTREFGFRGVTLVCGLTALLLAARMLRRGKVSLSGAAGLGAAVGVGWWSSPEVLYYLVGAAVLLGWGLATRRLRSPLVLAIGLVTAAAGAAPWLYANFHSHFASVRHQTAGAPASTYGMRIDAFFTKTLPMLLGERIEGAGAWVAGSGVGHVLFVVAIVVVVGGMVGLVMEATPYSISVVGALAVFPWLYCAFPPTIFWNDGRYGVFLPPLCALAVAGGWPIVIRRLLRAAPTWARAVPAAACVVALGAAGAATWEAFTVTFPRPGGTLALRPVGNTVVDRVVSTLLRHHLTEVVGNYWTAYDIDFVSGGRITAATLVQDRIPAANQVVLRSPHAVWLFTGPTTTDVATTSWQFGVAVPNPVTLTATQFITVLRAHGIPSTTRRIGDMVAVSPYGVTAATVAQLMQAVSSS